MGGNPTRGTSESSPQTKVPLHEASAPSPAINSPADRPPSPGARARSAALVEQHNWINFLDAAAKVEERAWLDYMRRLFSDATAKSTPWSSRNDGYSRDRPASAMASPASAIWRTPMLSRIPRLQQHLDPQVSQVPSQQWPMVNFGASGRTHALVGIHRNGIAPSAAPA